MVLESYAKNKEIDYKIFEVMIPHINNVPPDSFSMCFKYATKLGFLIWDHRWGINGYVMKWLQF